MEGWSSKNEDLDDQLYLWLIFLGNPKIYSFELTPTLFAYSSLLSIPSTFICPRVPFVNHPNSSHCASWQQWNQLGFFPMSWSKGLTGAFSLSTISAVLYPRLLENMQCIKALAANLIFKCRRGYPRVASSRQKKEKEKRRVASWYHMSCVLERVARLTLITLNIPCKMIQSSNVPWIDNFFCVWETGHFNMLKWQITRSSDGYYKLLVLFYSKNTSIMIIFSITLQLVYSFSSYVGNYLHCSSILDVPYIYIAWPVK